MFDVAYEIYVVTSENHWYVGSSSGKSPSAHKRFIAHTTGRGADGFKFLIAQDPAVKFTLHVVETGHGDFLQREHAWWQLGRLHETRECLNRRPPASWSHCNTGVNLSDEHRRKISEAQKGKPRNQKFDEETRKKLSDAGRGRKRSSETRRLISEAAKRQIRVPHTEEAKRKISVAMSTRVVSEETKRKIGETNRVRMLAFYAAQRKEVKHE